MLLCNSREHVSISLTYTEWAPLPAFYPQLIKSKHGFCSDVQGVFTERLEYSLMTIYVMTMGELNYHDEFVPWEKLPFPTLTNILFLVLVLAMPIILMNMLVSLTLKILQSYKYVHCGLLEYLAKLIAL